MGTIISLPLAMLGMAPGPMLAMIALAGLLWMLFAGMKNPMIWMILAILLLIVGVGGFAFGITDLIGLYAHRGPGDHPSGYEVDTAAAFVGGGAGAAVGGVVLLIVALMRQRKKAGPDTQP